MRCPGVPAALAALVAVAGGQRAPRVIGRPSGAGGAPVLTKAQLYQFAPEMVGAAGFTLNTAGVPTEFTAIVHGAAKGRFTSGPVRMARTRILLVAIVTHVVASPWARKAS